MEDKKRDRGEENMKRDRRGNIGEEPMGRNRTGRPGEKSRWDGEEIEGRKQNGGKHRACRQMLGLKAGKNQRKRQRERHSKRDIY